MERRGAFDYILLETSGLADPGNLAPLFWVDDGLGSSIYLDGIVVVADARNIVRTLDEGEDRDSERGASDDPRANAEDEVTTAHLQLSHADVIILNKADLVGQDELNTVVRRVQGINSLARLEVTMYSKVASLEGTILDLHAYDSVGTLSTETARSTHLDQVSFFYPFGSRLYQHKQQLHWSQSLNQDLQAISTTTISFPTLHPSQATRLDWWLQRVLWDRFLPEVDELAGAQDNPRFTVHRLKGRVALQDGAVKMIQGVREVFDITDAREDLEGSGDRTSKIVVIGKHISGLPWQESLERSLERNSESR